MLFSLCPVFQTVQELEHLTFCLKGKPSILSPLAAASDTDLTGEPGQWSGQSVQADNRMTETPLSPPSPN